MALPRQVGAGVLENQRIQEVFFQILESIVAQIEMVKSEPFQSCLEKVAPTLPKTRETEKVLALADEFNQALVANQQTKQADGEFESWVWNLTINGKFFLDSQVVSEIKPVSVPKAFERYLSVAPEELSCFDYAFFQIGEARALGRDYSNEEAPSVLSEWGYIPTKTPNPGDLVLYLDDDAPTHLGVYKGNGVVESKWGNNNPMAYIHKMTDAPPSYGNKVVFYRPPAKIPTVQELLASPFA